jgi:hypothetical protein
LFGFWSSEFHIYDRRPHRNQRHHAGTESECLEAKVTNLPDHARSFILKLDRSHQTSDYFQAIVAGFFTDALAIDAKLELDVRSKSRHEPSHRHVAERMRKCW